MINFLFWINKGTANIDYGIRNVNVSTNVRCSGCETQTRPPRPLPHLPRRALQACPLPLLQQHRNRAARQHNRQPVTVCKKEYISQSGLMVATSIQSYVKSE